MLTRYRRSLVLVALVAGLTALVGAAPAEAQTDYTISGRVVGASTGNPLPGANARIVGASFGTATDAEGRFSFTARLQPGQYQIRVSFVGYKTATRSIELGDQQEVTLDPFRLAVSAAQFEELVVTGQAGPTQRKKLGNAISTIDGAELEEAPSTTTLGALQGKLAGVNIQQNTGNPAGGTSIRLRGTSTVLGTADPLIVLDGVIISNDSPTTIDIGGGGGAQNRLLDLNPQDIARIEVVKGAAAAALYGSRANNGVVQIFTKMGDEGETEITYNTRVQTQAIRKTLDVNKAKNDQGQFLNNNGKPLPSDQKRWDYQDFIFDRAYGTEQYLSVSGGSEDTRFFTSAGFTNNQGIVSGTNFRRYNATARIRHTVNDWINIKAGARYARSASDDVPNGGVRATYGALTGFIFGPNTKDPRPKGGQYPNVTLFSNPLEVTNRFKFGQTTNRFIGDFQVDLSPLKGLSINSIVGLDTYEQVGAAYVPPNNTTLQFGGGFSERAEASNLQVNADLNVRYETDILPSLSSTSLIGASLQYENEESFTGNSRGLPLLTEVASAGSRDHNFGERRLP
ncbi:MAG: TonB-dependent receptor plug domain-containing protein, partial [Salinibacter sp.]